MGHVQINLFGSFHVERDGKSVDEQLARSPKGMLLMQYLILAPRQTAEAKTLMQVMWPEENSTSPDTALKTLRSRSSDKVNHQKADARVPAFFRGGK